MYFETQEESTIFQFCSSCNINLPCFCYHEKLTIAGNCRICLVEANNALVVSCAMPLLDNMRIYTNSKRVRKARESVLEFLLVNHPLDCPICDQGGECDLQDISLVFGSDRGRFYEYNKRSVDNLNCCGPLIKTVMTRCIHCTRCVRFITEISGTFDLGVLGRGNSMEIGTYIERFIFDELSANIIDLCPVGALTSMPYAFTARPWELSTYESIDILDSLASSINLSIANNKIMRVVPILDELVNEEWITNKARFAFDSLSIQRLNYPKVRLNDKLMVISWPLAFDLFWAFLISEPVSLVQAVIGHFSDLETTIALKDFFNDMGSSNLFYEDSLNNFVTDFRFSYLLNTTIVSLEQASIFLLLGTNLRIELPLLNSRIRKNYLLTNKQLSVYSVGLAIDHLTYPVKNLGNSLLSLRKILEGKSSFLKDLLFKDFTSLVFLNFKFFQASPKIFLGNALLNRVDGFSLYNSVALAFGRIFKKSFNYSYLNVVSYQLGKISASEVGLSSINSVYSTNDKVVFSYLCGTVNSSLIKRASFLVYQGLFKASGFLLAKADLILPTTSSYERTSSFLNIEGRLRFTKEVLTPFKFLYSDWDIVRALSFKKKRFLESNFSVLDNFFFLAFFNNVITYRCSFAKDLGYLSNRLRFISGLNLGVATFDLSIFNPFLVNLASINSFDFALYNSVFNRSINNYYSSDIFSKNSKVMSLCAIKTVITNFSTNI